ncbi:MAG: hypothetical protein K2Z81_11595 [Cyanobacteria bacterium]|nr:hypothetical protein [Cyanobacteriota bacterium]
MRDVEGVMFTSVDVDLKAQDLILNLHDGKVLHVRPDLLKEKRLLKQLIAKATALIGEHDVIEKIKYVNRLPKTIPEGMVLCHNHVRPQMPINTNGFRVFLAPKSKRYQRCKCGWADGIVHYTGITSK